MAGVSRVSCMNRTSMLVFFIYHAMYSAFVSVSLLQFHVATLKLPQSGVWYKISSEALHVLVMSELKVIWLVRSSCGSSE